MIGPKPERREIGCDGIRASVKAPGRYDCIMILDSETKAVELPEDHGTELGLWLRLLTCTTLIEGEVRSRLRERFDVTLPRFDLMASSTLMRLLAKTKAAARKSAQARAL